MKVVLSCDERKDVRKKFAMTVEVYALTFLPNDRTFSMPLCIGDDWLQKIECPISTVPKWLHFHWDRLSIHFEREQDANNFGAWLIEAEARAQEGYRTMHD